MQADPADLTEAQKEWLHAHYSRGMELADVAEEYGVTKANIYVIKHSPAGMAYARTLLYDKRDRINLRAAELILEVMQTQGIRIPVDTLVKIYTATIPKVAPVSFKISVETLRKEAEAIADKYDLDEESRSNLIDFVTRQKQAAQAQGERATGS